MTRALGSVTIFPSIMKLYSNDAKSVRSSASSHTSPIRYFGSNEISSHGFFSPGLYKSSRTSPARPCTRMWTPFSSCVTPSGYRILFLFRYSAILKSPVFPDMFYLLISATVTCGPEFPIINISKNIFLNNCRSGLFLLPDSRITGTTNTQVR